jgi:hypothetical protein
MSAAGYDGQWWVLIVVAATAVAGFASRCGAATTVVE